MTLNFNKLRYRHKEKLRIPASWINDGIEDCLTGEDEFNIWPTCKFLDTLRQVSDNRTCQNTFLCTQSSSEHIELEQLCDDKENCGKESSVCHAARLTKQPFVSPQLYQRHKHVLHCLPGMKSLENFRGSCSKKVFMNSNYPTFGVSNSAVLFIPKSSISCKHLFGELYIYMSCMKKCSDMECPLAPLGPKSCSQDSFTKTWTLSGNKKLTFVIKARNEYHNNLYQCGNIKCVSYEKVCNLVNDCGDNSDERHCNNSFQCKASKRFIYITSKCDGFIDCSDHSDECNTDCGKSIISGILLKVLAWIIGVSAICLNGITLFKLLFSSWSANLSARANRIFRILVTIGDFLTGLYLVLIAIIDSLIFGETYCQKQLVWQSSGYCAVLGVISTFGANISLYSMTCLSIFRATSLNNWGVATEEFLKFKLLSIIFVLTCTSATVSCIPLVGQFKDFFVNGITYEKNIRLFIATANKRTHLSVLKAYHGNILSHDISWDEITRLTDLMFTHDYGEIGRKNNHFYGNDGVCLFKYFVKNDDPQKFFVWINLALNFISSILICVCYIMIIFRARQAASQMKCMMASTDKGVDHQAERLQKNVARIIITDLMCWIPFLITCLLHSLEILDATFLYPFYSIVVLPINSVINPIVYDDFIRKKVIEVSSYVLLKFKNVGVMVSSERSKQEAGPELIGMRTIKTSNIEDPASSTDHEYSESYFEETTAQVVK